MKVIWSDFASDILIDIYKYYKKVAGIAIARKIKSNIFASTNQLKKHPISGQIEDALRELGEDHRYLVEGNYKIVCKPVKEGILITDVFDSRQDPEKINKTRTKPSR